MAKEPLIRPFDALGVVATHAVDAGGILLRSTGDATRCRSHDLSLMHLAESCSKRWQKSSGSRWLPRAFCCVFICNIGEHSLKLYAEGADSIRWAHPHTHTHTHTHLPLERSMAFPLPEYCESRYCGSARGCRVPATPSARSRAIPCRSWPGSGGRRAEERLLVMNQDPVLEHGDDGRANELMVLVPARSLKNYVEGLPLAGLFAGVDQRRGLAVERAAFAVG